jgi:hypothetical protein
MTLEQNATLFLLLSRRLRSFLLLSGATRWGVKR